MSFIDKFLDVTAPLPRKIGRTLKLYKEAEDLSKIKKSELKNHRQDYLKKIKNKEINDDDDIIALKNKIDGLQSEILSLSDYKQEIIEELKYICEWSFLNKIEPIIEEGKKECQGQITLTNPNNNYSTNSFGDSMISKIMTSDFKKISDFNEKNPKNDIKFLEKKTHRKGKKTKAGTELPSNEEVKEIEPGKDVFCICRKQCFGNMIQCDRCKEWYHYECVNIAEGNEPKEQNWYCQFCDTKTKTQKKTKKKKKLNS